MTLWTRKISFLKGQLPSRLFLPKRVLLVSVSLAPTRNRTCFASFVSSSFRCLYFHKHYAQHNGQLNFPSLLLPRILLSLSLFLSVGTALHDLDRTLIYVSGEGNRRKNRARSGMVKREAKTHPLTSNLVCSSYIVATWYGTTNNNSTTTLTKGYGFSFFTPAFLRVFGTTFSLFRMKSSFRFSFFVRGPTLPPGHEISQNKIIAQISCKQC